MGTILIAFICLVIGFACGGIASVLTDEVPQSDIKELKVWWRLGYRQAISDVSMETDDVVLLRKLRKMERENGERKIQG